VDALQSIRDGVYDMESVPWSRYVSEILRAEIIALIFLRFIGLFGQTCLEVNLLFLKKCNIYIYIFFFQTIVTPMMKTYFNYGDFENSILYLSGGGELILVFVILTLASKKYSDKSIILVGICLNIVTYIWFISTVPRFQPG
jgi:hypothetical protein